MTNKTITITNPARRRKWGYGLNVTPTRTRLGLVVFPPTEPEFTGTIRQVYAALAANRFYQSLRGSGTLYNLKFFYDDNPIAGLAGLIDNNEVYPLTFWDYTIENDVIEIVVEVNDERST